ncbi:MAG: hypothetical protein GY731_14390 [Gammaproteobacteria bacterium]|nr:hypothetical protein [Gammaproteobacteria bacterium]
MNQENPPEKAQRLDKWLWAARLFKTRGLAVEAINGGKVQVDGQRVKPARNVHQGMEVRIHKKNFQITVIIQGLARQRRPAKEAVLLYRETDASRRRREEAAELRRQLPETRLRGSGRPTKRDRRHMTKFAGE